MAVVPSAADLPLRILVESWLQVTREGPLCWHYVLILGWRVLAGGGRSDVHFRSSKRMDGFGSYVSIASAQAAAREGPLCWHYVLTLGWRVLAGGGRSDVHLAKSQANLDGFGSYVSIASAQAAAREGPLCWHYVS
jgi:hypothetical protein